MEVHDGGTLLLQGASAGHQLCFVVLRVQLIVYSAIRLIIKDFPGPGEPLSVLHCTQ